MLVRLSSKVQSKFTEKQKVTGGRAYSYSPRSQQGNLLVKRLIKTLFEAWNIRG